VANIAAAAPDRAVQFNAAGTLAGDTSLTWNTAQTLVIGDQIPDTYYWLDSGFAKIHDLLAIQGNNTNAILSIHGADVNYPTVSLSSEVNNGVGQANLNISNADTVTTDTLNIQFNGANGAQFNANGMSVGALYLSTVGSPVGYLEVYADGQADMGNFYSTYDNSDNGVRLQTAGANSTVGLVLQQTNADAVAGIRLGQTGNLSLHTGLNNGADLNDSSIVVLVDQSGRMGIGITQPQYRLDVDGGLQWNLPNSANVAPVSTGIVGVAVDSWDVDVYRSADYTVQSVDSVGLVEITKLLVMHQQGVAYQTIYANLNDASGTPGPTILGSFVASINGNIMQLIYSAVANATITKVDVTYITI
jgi:hypothetical protein